MTRLKEEMMDEVMTAKDVALLLKVHMKTIYFLARRGEIPGKQIGKSWRFRRSDILEAISNRSK